MTRPTRAGASVSARRGPRAVTLPISVSAQCGPIRRLELHPEFLLCRDGFGIGPSQRGFQWFCRVQVGLSGSNRPVRMDRSTALTLTAWVSVRPCRSRGGGDFGENPGTGFQRPL